MPAIPLVVAFSIGTGLAASIGTALLGTVVAASAITPAVATAVGAGVLSGGMAAFSGGSVSDVLKTAVIGGVTEGVGAWVGAEIAETVSAAASAGGESSIASTMGVTAKTLGNIAGQTVGGGISSALTAAVYGKDPVNALIKGGLTAGLSSGVMEAVNWGTSKIEGFGELPDAVQRATKAALAAGVLGKDPEKAALSAFLASTTKYIGGQLKDFGDDLIKSYNTAQDQSKALEDNFARQNVIVDEYNKLSTSLNSDYQKMETLREDANDAIKKFEDFGYDTARGHVQIYNRSLRWAAEEKVNIANDFIAEYDKKFTEGKATLDSLSTELDDLKAKLPDQAKAFTDSKVALEDTAKQFQTQEAKNADTLANTVKNLEAASTQVKNDLGIDLGEDQIKQFVESGNVNTAAQAFIDTTNQDSQDLGFENYKDQTAAAENGFTKDEASQWGEYKDTSGVVAGITPGAGTTGTGGQTDIANLFEPTQAAADQTNTDQNAPKTGVSTDQQVALGKPFQYSAEELYQDTLPQDLAMAMSQRTPDVSETPPLDLKTAQLDQTLPEKPDQIQQLLDSFRQQTAPSERIQTAAFTMPGTMSDVGGGDIGLRTLISQQQGGTNAESGTLGLGSIADRNLASAPSGPDLNAVTPGTATYSALTGTDPTKTITSSVLGEDKGDVRGGIESSALYSGAKNELAPSDLLSSKYLSENPDEKKALEDVGVTGGDAAKTATPTPSGTFVNPLSIDRAVLPVSSEASQTQIALKGNKMGEDDINTNNTDNNDNNDTYLDNYNKYGLQVPPGAEPETSSSNVPDYGEGWVRNLNDNSQELQTENGKVIYYDDGRVVTLSNDGRYTLYGADGRVIDYSNINDPKARVRTFMPGANGVPSWTYENGTSYPGATPPTPGLGTRIAQSITNQLTKDPLKFLTAAGGALAGAASKPKGIQPRGLQSDRKSTRLNSSHT